MPVTAYTDGSSIGNPGPAGWAVLLEGELVSDWLPFASNNEAELYAILQAAMLCPAGEELHIYTDSKLAIGWLCWSWRIRSTHIQDLVRTYSEVVRAKDLTVRLFKVKGHSSEPGNDRVDRAAKAQARIAYSLFFNT